MFLLENGTSDPFYQRFITPKQNSLIIGSSRAAQGIHPSIINNELELDQDSKIFNYSFTAVHSPYGEIYSKSIFQKLNKETSSHGLFILAIDPWVISSSKLNPDDKNLFLEKNRFLNKLIWVNGFMNLQYLLQFYENSFYEILMRKVVHTPTILHKDGWLEVNMMGIDTNYEKFLKRKIIEYHSHLHNNSFSNSKYQSFLNLIIELQKRGDVFLVRLPMDVEILKIENELMPELNVLIKGVSSDLSIPFLDFSDRSTQFKYTDGNHLVPESGKKVSFEIAKWVDSNIQMAK